SLRRVAVRDFWVTAGMARRRSLKRQGRSQSSLRTLSDHLSSTWSSSSRCAFSIRSSPLARASSVSGTIPGLLEVSFGHQVSTVYLPFRHEETPVAVRRFTPEGMLQPTPYE